MTIREFLDLDKAELKAIVEGPFPTVVMVSVPIIEGQEDIRKEHRESEYITFGVKVANVSQFHAFLEQDIFAAKTLAHYAKDNKLKRVRLKIH